MVDNKASLVKGTLITTHDRPVGEVVDCPSRRRGSQVSFVGFRLWLYGTIRLGGPVSWLWIMVNRLFKAAAHSVVPILGVWPVDGRNSLEHHFNLPIVGNEKQILESAWNMFHAKTGRTRSVIQLVVGGGGDGVGGVVKKGCCGKCQVINRWKGQMNWGVANKWITLIRYLLTGADC